MFFYASSLRDLSIFARARAPQKRRARAIRPAAGACKTKNFRARRIYVERESERGRSSARGNVKSSSRPPVRALRRHCKLIDLRFDLARRACAPCIVCMGAAAIWLGAIGVDALRGRSFFYGLVRTFVALAFIVGSARVLFLNWIGDIYKVALMCVVVYLFSGRRSFSGCQCIWNIQLV